ncbi:MAG: hypothetical protein GY835_20515 [bacterium]|nr:hypothetical protein [bacterium]
MAEGRKSGVEERVSANRTWPLVTALLLFWLTIAMLFMMTTNACDGSQVYTLDDAYIHLSLARNLAHNGSWGLEANSFDSVSSSLLWPILLSPGYLPHGLESLTPLLLNIILATMLIMLFDRGLRDVGLGSVHRYLLLLILIFLAPLPALVFSGMEHILQALLALLLLYLFLDDYRRDGDDAILRGMRRVAILFCAFLLTATRLEGLFLVLPMAASYLVRFRIAPPLRMRQALSLIIAGLLPFGLFAGYSRFHGGGWLPNSIMAKGKGLCFTSPGAWLNSVIDPLLAHLRQPLSPFSLHFLLLLLLALILPLTAGALLRRFEGERFVSLREGLVRGRLAWVLLGAAILLQLLFGGVGWFFRYETWLVILGLYVLSALLPAAALHLGVGHNAALRVVIIILMAALGVSLGARGVVSLTRIVPATRNIHQQPVQVGLFLQAHYPGQMAVIGDLGAASYLGGRPYLDLMGLASPEVAAARKAGNLTPAFVDSLAARIGASVAIVHDRIFADIVPETWVKTGEWVVENNVILGDETISFYALDGSGTVELREYLIEFASGLPTGIEVRLYP